MRGITTLSTVGKLVVGAAAITTAALVGSGAAAAENPTILRLHTYLPAGAPLYKSFFAPWGQKIEQESNGRIKVELYPSMQLGGSPTALFDQVKDGVVDLSLTPMLYTPNRFPLAEVFDLPFVNADAVPTSRAAWEYYEKYMQDSLKEVKVISLNVHGPGAFHVRGASIAKLDDLKGLKVRGPNRIINDMLKAEGAIPVSIPGAGISEALSKGVIDAGTYPWEAVPALKIHELVNSHTIFGGDRALYSALFVFAMNKRKYENLPADLRQVIDANSGIETGAWAAKVMADADGPGMEVAKAAGNTIHVIDGAEEQRWREAAKPMLTAWFERMKKLGHDGNALLADHQALIEKHSQAK